jgi:AcrR family transcriptional regulator
MAHVKQAAAIAENEARKGRTRVRLMNAAIDVIARKGFAGCQVRDIVGRARVSIGTFYLYFDDKRDAFLRILEENNDLLRRFLEERIARAQAVPDLAHALRLIYESYFDFIDAHRNLFLCFFRSGAYVARGFGENVGRMMADAAADTRRRLQLGMDAGFVRRDLDLDVLGHAISGMLVEVGHRYVLGTVKKPQALDTLVAFSLDGLRNPTP